MLSNASRCSNCRPVSSPRRSESLICKIRLVWDLNDDVTMTEGGVAGIASLSQSIIGLCKLALVTGLNRGFKSSDRLAGHGFHQLRHRLIAKARPPYADIRQCSFQLVNFIGSQCPVLFTADQAKLGVPRLDQRIHEVAETRVEWRGQRRQARSLRVNP